jgi:hypothetical protein
VHFVERHRSAAKTCQKRLGVGELAPGPRQLTVEVYAREQVAHAWLLDPVARTLEVLRLESGRWVILATDAGGDVVRAEPFAQVEIDLRALWAEPAEGAPTLPPAGL